LRHIQSVLQQCPEPSRQLLDYGCGSGRYGLPLAQEKNLIIHAYDVCDEAIDRLRQRLQETVASQTIHIINESEVLAAKGCYDVALLLFGVLSHIPEPEERQQVLRTLGNGLKPDRGRLILSVPNVKRRFLQVQKHQRHPAGDIQYQRQYRGQALHFFYHLYDRGGVVAELQAAGFQVEHLVAESILPESWLCHRPYLRGLDRCLQLCLPVDWGYGFLVTARYRHHASGGK
ncbi:MAG: hypothetical protein ETSY2_52175, partial [Candidatus Entotheonella gemina]